MHLVHELVLGVLEVNKAGGVAGRDPGPGTGPGVSLGRDGLFCGAGCADAVNGGLVEVEDEVLGHVVELVVCVEDDEGVVLELGRYVGPPRLEGRCVGDDVAHEASIVVRLDHGVAAFAGDVVDLLGQVAQVVGVESAGEGVGG